MKLSAQVLCRQHRSPNTHATENPSTHNDAPPLFHPKAQHDTNSQDTLISNSVFPLKGQTTITRLNK